MSLLFWLLWVVICPLIPVFLPLLVLFFKARFKEWPLAIIDGDLLFSAVAVYAITLSELTLGTPSTESQGHVAFAIITLLVTGVLLVIRIIDRFSSPQVIRPPGTSISFVGLNLDQKRTVHFSIIVTGLALAQSTVVLGIISKL